MARPLRLALGVLGLATAIYGTASLTGDWLGTPPWGTVQSGWHGTVRRDDGPERRWGDWSEYPNRLRERMSFVVVAFGLALVGFAAWPRRSESAGPTGL